MRHLLAVALLAMAGAAGPAIAQEPTPAPAATPTLAPAARAAEQARTTFANRCAGCHGLSGRGGFGPPLQHVEDKGDDFIRMRIREGSPKGMPPFRAMIDASELDELVGYVKRL